MHLWVSSMYVRLRRELRIFMGSFLWVPALPSHEFLHTVYQGPLFMASLAGKMGYLLQF